jgi:hypothetical protein
MNADAIAVFKSLSNDEALRDSVVAAASSYAEAARPSADTTAKTTAHYPPLWIRPLHN